MKGAKRKSSVTPQLHQNVRVIRGESEPNAGGTAYELLNERKGESGLNATFTLEYTGYIQVQKLATTEPLPKEN